MTRKALLIGAQTNGLTGVDNDVKSMRGALAHHGFTVNSCEAENASRAGILDAYEQLIADAQPDDSVFVYYSGHGGFYRPPDYQTVVRPRVDLQFIVPADFHESAEGDFRGITSIELSLLLDRLTQKTANVAVALDCCHAAHMSRDDDLRVKALAHPAPYDILAAHLQSLQRRGQSMDRWTSIGNANAVRIVACAPDQSAYEYTNQDGQRNGALTEALTLALSEVGELRVTWSTLAERVRRRVLTLMPNQRPEAEGPSRRLLFELEEADPVGTLPVIAVSGDRVRLDGGPLLGVRTGDELAIMPSNSTGPDDPTKIGDVAIDALDAVAAFGRLQFTANNTLVPIGARAHRTRVAAVPFAVRVPAADPRGEALARAIASSPQLRAGAPGEDCLAEVRIDAAGQLTVCDQLGPLHTPRDADHLGIAQVVRDLQRLAQANTLRRLTEEAGYVLDAPVTVEFGLVDAGAARPLSSSGAVVYVNQRVYLRVTNNSPQTVYVSLLDIGILAKVTLLNSVDPSGTRLDPGKEFVFGWNDFAGVLTGTPVTWPDGLAKDQPRPETVVAIFTSAPQDLRVFEQDGVPVARGTQRSSLEQLFDQMAHGVPRDLVSAGGPTVRYAVHTIDFDVMPVGEPRDEEVRFEVDERPEPSARLVAARGGEQRTVALILSDLVVHHNRAIRSADIRLDAVVLTGSNGAQPVYQAQTERFHNIRDGERLPLDRMLIYHGPAVDYLDLAVWVSRDSAESLALSDLLKDKLTEVELPQAMEQLGSLVVAAPHAALAVAAVGAGAIIINAAYHLLRGAVGDSVGLYRTTLLAQEQFGIGRSLGQNIVRAQDFSFAYAVRDVS